MNNVLSKLLGTKRFKVEAKYMCRIGNDRVESVDFNLSVWAPTHKQACIKADKKALAQLRKVKPSVKSIDKYLISVKRVI
jgi:hypothetical protein